MSYTGLVHWHASVQGTLSRPAVRRLERRPAPPVARPHTPSATPSYGGLVGWYAAVLSAAARPAAAPVPFPSLPQAA